MSRKEKIFLSNGFSGRNEGKHSKEVKLFELFMAAKFPCCPFQGKLSLPLFLRLPASFHFPYSVLPLEKLKAVLMKKEKMFTCSRTASKHACVNA